MSVKAELENSVQYSLLQRMRHSAAHVMAEAVQEMFLDARFAIGPAIEDGFYYDFDLPQPLTPADFPEIEQRMAKIIVGKYPFVRDHFSAFVVKEDQAEVESVYEVAMLTELDRITSNIPQDELAIQWDTAIEFAILERAMPTFLTDSKAKILEWLMRLGNKVPVPEL